MHLTTAELEAGMDHVRRSPVDDGRVELIVRRPVTDEREVMTEAFLDETEGLVGDSWLGRGSRSTPDGQAEPGRQITIMNARAATLIAGGTDRIHLAGDQLFLDLDLSVANLAPGTRLRMGAAVVEISEAPHLGCHKFRARFGPDALAFVNAPEGRAWRLRGVNTRVVVSGTVRTGDRVAKVSNVATETPVRAG